MELPRRLIKLYSYVGDVVLDPFCGSGVTLRAAMDLDRRAIGIDISRRYCAMSANRCRQQLLFAPETDTSSQLGSRDVSSEPCLIFESGSSNG